MSQEYVCEVCKKEGEETRMPADFVGIELMRAHFQEKHPEIKLPL